MYITSCLLGLIQKLQKEEVESEKETENEPHGHIHTGAATAAVFSPRPEGETVRQVFCSNSLPAVAHSLLCVSKFL